MVDLLRVLAAPRLLALHLLALVATFVAVALGFWQFEAWEARRAAEARDLANARPVPLSTVMSPDDPFPAADVGRPVELAGAWVPESTFGVADRALDGERGFWVVTPVAVCADGEDCTGKPAMLVVRGWSLDEDEIRPPAPGPVEVTGWLQPPEGAGLRDPDPTDDVLAELRIADAIQRVDQDLYGGYVIARDLAPAPDSSLAQVTPDSLPEPQTFTALRNLLYALEWWVFAAFALFIWSRWLNDEVQRLRATGAEVPSSA